MRRTLLMVMAVALLLTQCRKPAVELPTAGPANENMVSMTVTVGHGRTSIGADGAIKWSKNDKLYVGDGSKYIGYLTLVGDGGDATGTFSGTVSATAGSYTFGFYYLGSKDYTSGLNAGTSTSVDIPFGTQTGLRESLSDCHIGYGTASGRVDVDGKSVILDSTDPVQMTSKVAIAYFDFKENGTSDYTGAIKLSGTNICNEMTVEFSGAESGMFTGKTVGAISLTDNTSSKKYVMLVPPENVVEETLEFGGAYEGTTKFYKGIEANKFYCLGEGKPIEVSVTPWEPTWVDLGLSVRWATCNLGATSPGDYGDYYQWGGVTYVTSTTIDVGWENCPHTNGTYSSTNMAVFTKYVPSGKSQYWGGSGDPDNLTTLELADDAAHVVWGGDWRMPTAGEFQDLYNNTTCTWKDAGEPITIGGQTVSMPVAGYYCESTMSGYTGKYIFLPAAGDRDGTSLNGAGSRSYYWSSSLYTSYPYGGRGFYFISSEFYVSSYTRYHGCTVRPVCPPQN